MFYFYSAFFSCSTFYTDEKRGKVRFLLLEGGTAETQRCFICFRKAGWDWRIWVEGGRLSSPLPPSVWWKQWYCRDQRLGPINMASIKSSAQLNSCTHVRLSPKLPVVLMQQIPLVMSISEDLVWKCSMALPTACLLRFMHVGMTVCLAALKNKGEISKTKILTSKKHV